jgi:hypothetical protein
MLQNAGAKAKAVDAELEKPVTAEGDAVVDIDVDDMTTEQLDGLVQAQGVETPEEWAGWDVVAKRAWLNQTFGTPPGEVTVGEVLNVETPAASEADPAVIAADALVEVAKPKKGKGKKAKASTALSTDVAKDGVIVEADPLLDMVHEIENMKEKEVYDVIAVLMEQTDITHFKLGGILSIASANQWFQGYASFREFVEGKYGLAYRKAMYLIEIYNKLANSGIPWEKFKDLGWTKIQVIARIVNKDNVDQWVAIATEQNLMTLLETVKSALSKKPDQIEGEVKTVTTMSFKVHQDQKISIDSAIAKAKEAAGTDVGTVALDFICIEYLGGQSLAQRIATVGPSQAGKAVAQAFAANEEMLTSFMVEIGFKEALSAVAATAPQYDITVDTKPTGNEQGGQQEAA